MFRTPPGVKVGREPFDESVRQALEAQNPGVLFDWTKLSNIPPPAVDVEFWRERRRAEKAAKQARRAEEAAESATEAQMSASPEATDLESEIEPSDEPFDESEDLREGTLDDSAAALELSEAAPGSTTESPGAPEHPDATGINPGNRPDGQRRRRRRGGRRRRRAIAQTAVAGTAQNASQAGTDAPKPQDQAGASKLPDDSSKEA
jgi:hypothetical protein